MLPGAGRGDSVQIPAIGAPGGGASPGEGFGARSVRSCPLAPVRRCMWRLVVLARRAVAWWRPGRVNGGGAGGGSGGGGLGVGGDGGGGASDVRSASLSTSAELSLGSRLLVAGGGGGAASADLGDGQGVGGNADGSGSGSFAGMGGAAGGDGEGGAGGDGATCSPGAATSASPAASVRAVLGQLAQARTEAPTAVVARAAVTTVAGAVKAEPAPTSDARPPEAAGGAQAT